MIIEKKFSGETMDEFITRIKIKYNIIKMGYTARLDPMAKGLVPLVIENECSNIKNYFGTNKYYQVKIILGLQTDSDDPLGIIINKEKITESNYMLIKKFIISYLDLINNTTFEQKYHYFYSFYLFYWSIIVCYPFSTK
jgi:tRNA U55 pseudouridine synthase TruB